MPGELLPIKVVFPSKGDFQRPASGGSERRVFIEVTPSIRDQFVSEVGTVKRAFSQSFRRFPEVPAVARVKLRPDALAKTHRPSGLFNKNTCPVIGSASPGELLVSVTPQGLDGVAERIASGTSSEAVASISALAAIQPYHAMEFLEDQVKAGNRVPMACRLFRHPTAGANAAVERALAEVVKEAGGKAPTFVWYTDELSVFSLGNAPDKLVKAVAAFVGTQSVCSVPDYKLVRSSSRPLEKLTPERFPAPEPNQHYGLVGLIDSGTDPTNTHVQAWVEARYEFVPPSRQKNDHGTFVAGLLIHGRRLNNNDGRFPAGSSRIVDVVAIDEDGQINETDLILIIDTVLAKFPHVKVWNLSLSLAEEVCSDWKFSWLGAALDARSKKFGVLFVIAAGNYNQRPLRSWPAQTGIGEHDRISPPADSVRALTVGSVAHLESASARVKVGDPSPFSRRGPGPAYLIKPELSHCGGNCDKDGVCSQIGVVSVDEHGQVCENIGTSFATPLVSNVAAQVYHELAVDPESVSPLVLKAMLVHSAFLKQPALDAHRLNYLGLGPPADAAEIVSCSQSMATLVLQIPVTANPQFVKEPFPLIDALEDGGNLRGEVFMTLAHDTPLDANYNVDYCRTNVTASLGAERIDDETGEVSYPRQVEPAPKSLVEGYEQDLVRHGFKWSPLKLYYRKFARFAAGRPWRLLVERLDRAEFVDRSAQQAVVLITVRDPSGRLPVYDRVVRAINQAGWVSQDLRVRSRSRLQA